MRQIGPRHFGIDSQPTKRADKSCVLPGARPIRFTAGLDYELQSFACRQCSQEIHRSADGAGLLHASDAVRWPLTEAALFADLSKVDHALTTERRHTR
jgi:hypothetical protein